MTIQHLDKSKRLEVLAKAIIELSKDKSEANQAVKKIEKEIEDCKAEVKELLGNGIGGYHVHRFGKDIGEGNIAIVIGHRTGGNHWMPAWEKEAVVLASAKYLKGKGV